MQVIFLHDVDGVAQGGDIKEVKNGFARNYLLPKNLAIPVTKNALEKLNKIKKNASKDRIKYVADMQSLATSIQDTRINIEMRADSNNQLYGSVNNSTISEQLTTLFNRDFHRNWVTLDEPIRQLGLFTIPINLTSEISTSIDVLVYPLGITAEDFENSISSTEEPIKDSNTEAVDEPDDNITGIDEPDDNITGIDEPDDNITGIDEPDDNITGIDEPDEQK